MTGYFNNAQETTRSLRVHPDAPHAASGHGPWLHTGDLGYLDEDFYLFIVDRQKDLIKTSGYQVWPREIEEVLASHPSVLEVGVAGVPDEVKGEVVKAWIVKRADTNPTIEEFVRIAGNTWRRTRHPRTWSSGSRYRRPWRAKCFAVCWWRNTHRLQAPGFRLRARRLQAAAIPRAMCPHSSPEGP